MAVLHKIWQFKKKKIATFLKRTPTESFSARPPANQIETKNIEFCDLGFLKFFVCAEYV